jgi:hypothetical protein
MRSPQLLTQNIHGCRLISLWFLYEHRKAAGEQKLPAYTNAKAMPFFLLFSSHLHTPYLCISRRLQLSVGHVSDIPLPFPVVPSLLFNLPAPSPARSCLPAVFSVDGSFSLLATKAQAEESSFRPSTFSYHPYVNSQVRGGFSSLTSYQHVPHSPSEPPLTLCHRLIVHPKN